MAVHRPWRDLPSAYSWNDAARKEGEQKWKNTQKTKVPYGPGLIKKTMSVGQSATNIGLELTAYHAIPKANLDFFPPRAAKLRELSAMATKFLTTFGWDEQYSKTWSERNRLDCHQNLARLALSIQNRGLAKADYLEILSNFYVREKKGSTTENLLDLLSKQQKRTPNRLGLVQGVRLEKIDPFHRVIEGTFSREGLTFDGPVNTNLPMARAFDRWLEALGNNPGGTPHFYIWLEDYYVCTGEQDQHSQYVKDTRSVSYGDTNLTWCKVLLPGSPVYWRDSSGEGVKEIADTLQPDTNEKGPKYFRTYTVDGQTHNFEGAAAYVWDTTNTVFLFAHISERQHHSSGTQGKVVHCAGNVIIRNGQIICVDGDSGHYRPDKEHILSFCTHLEKYYGMNGQAIVGWFEDGGMKAMTWGAIRSPWVRGFIKR